MHLLPEFEDLQLGLGDLGLCPEERLGRSQGGGRSRNLPVGDEGSNPARNILDGVGLGSRQIDLNMERIKSN